MPKCPNCKKEIKELNEVVSGHNTYRCWLDFDGLAYELKDFQSDSETNEWRCPECDETIAKTEEKALEFLSNKKEPTHKEAVELGLKIEE